MRPTFKVFSSRQHNKTRVSYLTLTSIWHVVRFASSERSLYFPAGISIQFIPTT